MLLVNQLAGKLRHWWRPTPQQVRAPVPFEVVCYCNQTTQGLRQAKHQVVRCAHCGRNLFVLPYSPLPPLAPLADEKPGASSFSIIVVQAGGPRLQTRLVGVLGLVLAAGTMLSGILFFSCGPATPPEGDVRTLDHRLEAGKEFLRLGHFRLAAEEFQAARSRLERRDLTQLSRQANLFADALDWSPTDDVRKPLPAEQQLSALLRKAPSAGDLVEREWQAQFARRYRGRALIFDATVHRDAGRYYLRPPLQDNARKAWIDLSEVKLLHDLRVDWPCELLFGARLAGCRLEPPGQYWVFRFEPESGVLLTDASAVEAYFGMPLDAKRRKLLEQQTAWLAELP
jgi:hypothetical protein